MNRLLLSNKTFARACVGFFLLLSTVKVDAQAQNARVLGTVNSVNTSSVTVTADDGKQTTVVLTDSTRILRASPGQSELKDAAPASGSEIEPGDRVLVRGQSSADGTLAASFVVLMKKTDISERQKQERDEWRHGIGGIVRKVNPALKTVTIGNALGASGKPITIHISDSAVIRRYSPDSVKFEDSKPGTLDEITPGDQLRARGTPSADGGEFSAQGIVSGRFRDIAGTVVAVDQTAKSITVMDLAAKAPVTLKISADSDLRKLPPPLAQMIAARLKGAGTAGAPLPPPGGFKAETQRPRSEQGAEAGRRPGPEHGPGTEPSAPGNDWKSRPPDFQQVLNRVPSISIGDLEKGQAVILVSTEGSASSRPTAIKVLAGVEPILTAAPTATSILSPWNLGASPGGGADAVQ